MNKRKIGLLYALTLLFAVVFFIFYLFPGQKIEKYLMDGFGRAFPGFALAVAKIRPALPFAVKLSGVTVTQEDRLMFETDVVKIGLPVKSVFSPGTSLFVRGKVYGGKANGIVRFVEKSGSATADFEFSGIRIEKIPAVAQMGESGISGALSGTLTGDSAASSGQVSVKLLITDLAIPISTPLLKLADVSFKVVEMDASLNLSDFLMTQCVFKGNQLDGEMTGKMALKDPFEASLLDLTGTLEPHPEFLKNFPIQMLPMRQGNKKNVGFKISGTLGKPGFSFR
jgi:type II secretion system protein N